MFAIVVLTNHLNMSVFFFSSGFLTIPPSLVLNSPVNFLTRSRSSHLDALNSISKGLNPLLAIRFTERRETKTVVDTCTIPAVYLRQQSLLHSQEQSGLSGEYGGSQMPLYGQK